VSAVADPPGGPAGALPSPPAPEATAAPRTDLGRVAARGAGVTLAGQGARILLQLASVTVLARLLSPEDYGLLAVGLIVVGIGEVFRDLGLSTAAIRSPGLTAHQRDGLFWLNVTAGTVLAAVAVLASEPVAGAFGEAELADIVRWLSLTFLLNGLAAQYRAGLTRELRFGAVAGCDLGAQLLAFGVAVTAAAAGAGYWALVAQQLTQGAVALVVVVALGRWAPGRPRRGVGLAPLVRFGGGLTGTHLVFYVGNNLDNMVLGLTAGPAALGIYNRGFQLLMTPLNQLRSPATTVAVPVLSRLQDDLDRAGDYLRRSQLALGFSLVAGMALAAGAAGPLVEVMLGDRWAGGPGAGPARRGRQRPDAVLRRLLGLPLPRPVRRAVPLHARHAGPHRGLHRRGQPVRGRRGGGRLRHGGAARVAAVAVVAVPHHGAAGPRPARRRTADHGVRGDRGRGLLRRDPADPRLALGRPARRRSRRRAGRLRPGRAGPDDPA
jgi:hypothetical protein